MSMNLELPSLDIIGKYVSYDPDTGVFHRVINHRRGLPEEAGVVRANGYRMLWINKRVYYAHRVAWKIITGSEPVIIDHIDGDKLNNRASNLRSVPEGQNQKNSKRQTNNTSGYVGVSKSRNGKWRAYIKVDGKQKCLGTYDNLADAIKVRRAANREFGYHENHGRG